MKDLKGWLRRLEREAEEDLITFELADGSTARFTLDAFEECFLREDERSRAHYDGEEVPPAHPMTVALREAKDLEAVVKEYGTMMGIFVGEDEIMRGVRERPGPPVKWNEEGTVCQ